MAGDFSWSLPSKHPFTTHEFSFNMTLGRSGWRGLTAKHGELFIADDVVTVTSPVGLELGVLKTIWEERFISKSKLRI